MNYVQFTGKVASVNAYTDESYKVIDSCAWTVTEDYYSVTLVYSVTIANEERDETSWIKARFPKKQFNKFFERHKPEDIKFMGVEGAIKTAISRGSGYVSNYIEVNNITLCLTK